MELAGLLERTPIGSLLKQGAVDAGRPRRLLRQGLEHPQEAALVGALGRLFFEERHSVLALSEDLAWPWVLFGCERNSALARIGMVAERWVEIVDLTEVRSRIHWEDWCEWINIATTLI
ncbi:MAG: hypothetical protein WCP58_02530 [bacterium]